VPLTDETIAALHEAGMIHCLLEASGGSGARATKDDEIVALNLSGTKLQGNGLKFVAGLKNLTFLDLRNAAVNDAWLEDLGRALPNCKIVK
jgi:hypothetical protein